MKYSFLFLFSLTLHFTSLFAQNTDQKTIIIDPGHGGADGGTMGQKIKESAVALQVSMKLAEALKKQFPTYKIIMTRTTDIFPGNTTNKKDALYYRAEFANKNKGDLFISIHCNATGLKPGGWNKRQITGYKDKWVEKKVKGKVQKVKQREPIYKNVWVENKVIGTETFIWAADRSGAKSEQISRTQEEAYHENENLGLDLTSPEALIRAQLYEKKYFAKSLQFATLVEEEFVKIGRVSRGVKQRNEEGIWVLQATGMPSVLIELGFLSNTKEEEYLMSAKGQAESVDVIVTSLKRYFDLVK
ncbi:N-acetylmuramoyl-L-alanine amidase family protein [Gynurincola endophyticus]|uniref:N-acetylmuramoyl-L-alanine amidase family protein n=1 Tax=Gynurincola endophyticus TaxID=2479004 RepID=UPI000F8C926C|nr:N-acetylmuramoyl-L-alanine amidase [Gynurincola endophyticus]